MALGRLRILLRRAATPKLLRQFLEPVLGVLSVAIPLRLPLAIDDGLAVLVAVHASRVVGDPHPKDTLLVVARLEAVLILHHVRELIELFLGELLGLEDLSGAKMDELAQGVEGALSDYIDLGKGVLTFHLNS